MSSRKIHILDETIHALGDQAGAVAATLAAMAKPQRLRGLCAAVAGERSVGERARIVRRSPAALSQPLGKIRALRRVATRRDGQTIPYSLASVAVQAVPETLNRVYCGSDC